MEIRKNVLSNSGLLNKVGLLLGEIKDGDRGDINIRDNSMENVLLVSPCCNGKAEKFLARNNLVRGWMGSSVYLDYYGQLYNQYKESFKIKGGKNPTYRLDLLSLSSMGYNPITQIRIMTEYEESDIDVIVDSIMEDSEDNVQYKEKVQKTKILFKQVIACKLYESILKSEKSYYNKEDINISLNLFDILKYVDYLDKLDICRTQDIFNEYKKIYSNTADYRCNKDLIKKFGNIDNGYGFEQLDYTDCTDILYRALIGIFHDGVLTHNITKKDGISDIMGSNFEQLIIPNVSKEVHTKLNEKLPEIHTLSSPELYNEIQSLNIQNIFSEPMNLYVVIQPYLLEKEYRIIKLLISQIIHFSKTVSKARCKSILFLDELMALRKIPIFDVEDITSLKNDNMKIVACIQSISQIDKFYSNRDNFLSIFDKQLYYGTDIKPTIDYCKSKFDVNVTGPKKLKDNKAILVYTHQNEQIVIDIDK